ncbi:adenylosuccinate synthetase [Reyranella sp.]|uniref:adenylosuccinate synthetase n=1 Tax=Reyranella sp. TaxID=1929291 RepID=UPI003BAC5940
MADITLQTDTAASDELARVALALADIRPIGGCERLVDVFVGGQYGSEGKGNICSFLAHRYNVLVRVGGPNAGHFAPAPLYKYVQLPSGTGANPEAKILIAAGSTIWLPQLMTEIRDHGLRPDRLVIDPQAMIIDEEDRRIEGATVASIGSTRQGVGSASARKIMGRGNTPAFGPPVVLAKNVNELGEFVRDTKEELERALEQRSKVMLEGTQGTSLSIHHGFYPHVTSRETTASGCLADAGIAPHRVRKIVMVTRTYPIRVGGPSGPMGTEIDLPTIAQRSGIALETMRTVEKGTISGTQRRIAEFDWMQLRRSSLLNRPTDIALTFADYHGIANRGAKTFAGLLPETREFIDRIERVSDARVSLVSKEFAADGVIDRDGWQ